MRPLEHRIPKDWRILLAPEFEKDYFQELEDFLQKEREEHTIYPPEEEVFNALKYTSYDDVKVVILGQDPYHGPGQAHGLAFSVRPDVKVPPSLKNIYRELNEDLGFPIPDHGYLVPWARQGVLLLNAVLTVRKKEANSHQKKGWEKFTDAIIKKIDGRDTPAVFVFWGNKAKKKTKIIDEARTPTVTGAHPSPLSAHNGFFGTQPFSKINDYLKDMGQPPIDWLLPPADKLED